MVIQLKMKENRHEAIYRFHDCKIKIDSERKSGRKRIFQCFEPENKFNLPS